MQRIVIAAIFSILTVAGQEFEVASVKPADAKDLREFPILGPMAEMIGFEGGPGTKDPGRIRYHGVSLKAVLARAYDLKPYQVSGPGWLASEHYTIEATLPPGTDKDHFRVMLQKLLTERFQMTLHKETKEIPVYRLKAAKSGPKLKPGTEQPKYANDEERQAGLEKQAREMMAKMRAGGGTGNTRSIGNVNATLEQFAEALSRNLDRPVKDMTQIEGKYDFHLSWAPESGMRDGESGASIFTAIQEQLGLRLEAGNEPVELLVIDKVEKVPTSN
jgi:uncharacterized protein (TIGR03435 family)